jgi:general secretion pathway protein J
MKANQFWRPALRSPAAVGRRGFTLIELLVAISVLAIVAVLGWRGLDGIVRARISLNNALEQTRGLQLAFAQMQRDCAHVVGITTIPERAPIVVDPERLVLVRSVFSDNQPTRLQVVAYRLKDGVLTRRESTATRDLNALDALWMSATSDEGGAPSVELQSGVAAMTVRVWVNDGAGWRTPGVDVVTTASSGMAAATAIVPTGLEVGLQMRDRSSSLTKIFLLGAV